MLNHEALLCTHCLGCKFTVDFLNFFINGLKMLRSKKKNLTEMNQKSLFY